MTTNTNIESEKLLVAPMVAIRKKPMLIVEDDKALGPMLVEYVNHMQLYDPILAATVEEALEKFVPDKFFVVMMDLRLDGKDLSGVDLAVKFRSLDDDVVISIVTAFYPVYDQRLIEAADDLLSKPVEFDCLQSKLYLYAMQYTRRKALKLYVDMKMVHYKLELTAIRAMEHTLQENLLVFAEKIGTPKENE